MDFYAHYNSANKELLIDTLVFFRFGIDDNHFGFSNLTAISARGEYIRIDHILISRNFFYRSMANNLHVFFSSKCLACVVRSTKPQGRCIVPVPFFSSTIDLAQHFINVGIEKIFAEPFNIFSDKPAVREEYVVYSLYDSKVWSITRHLAAKTA